MRVDVALLPAALMPATLGAATVLVIDVLRASTTIVTALSNGCLAIVPLDDPDEARRRAAATPGLADRRGAPGRAAWKASTSATRHSSSPGSRSPDGPCS